MKKILIATNCIFLAIVLFQACSTTRLASVNGSFNMGNATNYASCYNCIVDDLHGETAAEFVDVTARYRTTHQELFNSFAKGQLNASPKPNMGTQVGDDFKDARSCWFSVDTLKKFICLMERYSKEVGVTSSQLGVRFYYGTYWSDYNRDPSLSDKHTLYLAATQDKDNTGLHQDFDPRASYRMKVDSGKGNVLVSLANQITNRATDMFIIGGQSGAKARRTSTAARSGDNIVMNQGDLCPPGKGCNTTIEAVDAQTQNGVTLGAPQFPPHQ